MLRYCIFPITVWSGAPQICSPEVVPKAGFGFSPEERKEEKLHWHLKGHRLSIVNLFPKATPRAAPLEGVIPDACIVSRASSDREITPSLEYLAGLLRFPCTCSLVRALDEGLRFFSLFPPCLLPPSSHQQLSDRRGALRFRVPAFSRREGSMNPPLYRCCRLVGWNACCSRAASACQLSNFPHHCPSPLGMCALSYRRSLP